MTRFEEMKTWNIEKMVAYMLLLERKIAKMHDIVDMLSDETIASQWTDILTKEAK